MREGLLGIVVAGEHSSYIMFKRVIDLSIASVSLALLLPLFACIAAAVKLDSAGPVLFRQKRVGIGKSIFYIYKFRTMRTDAPKDVPTHLFSGSRDYVTNVGRFLRRTSLDELPQLLNIIAGQMAFVGPRPALWNQYDLIAERDKYGANDILPGLTGWAQVNGRDELPVERKAAYDGEYVDRMSFSFDCLCICKTALCVLRGSGFAEGAPGTVCGDEKNIDNGRE